MAWMGMVTGTASFIGIGLAIEHVTHKNFPHYIGTGSFIILIFASAFLGFILGDIAENRKDQ